MTSCPHLMYILRCSASYYSSQPNCSRANSRCPVPAPLPSPLLPGCHRTFRRQFERSELHCWMTMEAAAHSPAGAACATAHDLPATYSTCLEALETFSLASGGSRLCNSETAGVGQGNEKCTTYCSVRRYVCHARQPLPQKEEQSTRRIEQPNRSHIATKLLALARMFACSDHGDGGDCCMMDGKTPAWNLSDGIDSSRCAFYLHANRFVQLPLSHT